MDDLAIKEQITYIKVKALEALTNKNSVKLREYIRELKKLDHLLYD